MILGIAEVAYLLDMISMYGMGPPDEEVTGRPYKVLLLKLMSGFDEMTTDAGLPTSDGKEVEVEFSEGELWILNEVTKTTVLMANQPNLGFRLKKKIVSGLLRVNGEVAHEGYEYVDGEGVDLI
jgi:hypothetical protein